MGTVTVSYCILLVLVCNDELIIAPMLCVILFDEVCCNLNFLLSQPVAC